MDWQLPGDPNSPVQKDFWNTDEGMRALYQHMADYFTGGGQNTIMGSWFNNQFNNVANRYKAEAIQNPNLDFGSWLQNNAPHLAGMFSSLPATLRGSDPNFMRRGRDLW